MTVDGVPIGENTTVQEGDEIEYIITVANTSDLDLYVEISDAMWLIESVRESATMDGLAFARDIENGVCIIMIPPNDERNNGIELRYSYVVTASDVLNGSVTNTATAVGYDDAPAYWGDPLQEEEVAVAVKAAFAAVEDEDEVEDEDDTEDLIFTDVTSGSYYYDAVYWAVENGVTAGTSTTTFSPDADCTRAQIVTFLYRYMG